MTATPKIPQHVVNTVKQFNNVNLINRPLYNAYCW
jgi:hypothetical protein